MIKSNNRRISFSLIMGIPRIPLMGLIALLCSSAESGAQAPGSTVTRRLARGSFLIGQHFHLPGGAAFVATFQDRESLIATRVLFVLHASFVAAGLALIDCSITLQLIGFAFAGT
jgi:hypothetical protein